MRIAILAILSLVTALSSTAQQVNPVPDYVFGNRMSVGRTTVTDTSAYFSIGPRFNATRGMQPPMVGDTNAVTGTKRNGLLIFSMQRNRYAYWDSAASRWREFGSGSLTSITAGTGLTGGTITTSGTIAADTLTLSTRAWRQKGVDSVNANVALKVNISDTSTMLSPYVRAAGFGLTKSGQSLLVDSVTMATRARVQKGIDSVAGLARVTGSGTTNFVTKFTASGTIGNTNIFENSLGVGIRTTEVETAMVTSGPTLHVQRPNLSQFWMSDTTEASNQKTWAFQYGTTVGAGTFRLRALNDARTDGQNAYIITRSGNAVQTHQWLTGGSERMRLTTDGELLIGTTTDAGAYALQVAGSIYNTTGAVFAATSGNVGIGTSSPSDKLDVSGFVRTTSGVKVTDGTIDFRTSWASGNRAYLGNFNNYPLSFYVNNSQVINIETGGGVGIGTTSTGSYRLSVVNSGAFVSLFESPSSETIIEFNNTSSLGRRYYLITGGSAGSFSNGRFGIFDQKTSSVRFVIDSTGLTGIGTAAPTERLHVNGRARIATIDSAASPINLLWANVNGVIQKTAVASVIGSGTANYIPKFATATTFDNSLIYQASSEVFINTTTDAGDFKLQVSGNTLVSDGQFRVNANANNGIVLSRSGTNSVVMYTSNTSGIMELGVAGATGGTGTGFTGYAGYLMTEAAYPLQFGSVDTMRMTLNTAGELLISTSTTDNGNYKLQVDGNVWTTGSITTGDPTSGTKQPWKLGSVVATSVQLDATQYVEVEINGTFYRLALVTPL